MTIPPADYKNWEELAEYARERAKHSATRNGHQEFAYWLLVHQWAKDNAAEEANPRLEFVAHRNITRSPSYDVGSKAESHAFAVHIRKMMINCGEKVERLSLEWLHKKAETL